ncbi:MAG: 23S rRNA (guanosine(2251)-2'-O)-methyltransferase RlmB [Bacteroidales bacterium OttesenSCG-928-I14]|jgi:23S rRNA (guanosine2251-2'-O)-methyltransferase|nr:23S rRNA (guanosine(2251)-2'-O)-methyltransferase RlmB [Bacteroidales bacterium OttesenSCG-928-I14]
MKKCEMIFGIRATLETIQTDKEINKILIRQSLNNKLLRKLFFITKNKNIPVHRVPHKKLNQLTSKNHQGVITFISAITYQKLENIVPFLYEEGKVPLILLLDKVTDVRNFGAIARSCVCTGVNAIVIPIDNNVSVNTDAIKTSAGALISLPVCRESSIINAIEFLKMCGCKIYASTEKAIIPYTKIDYTHPTAIVVGNENNGISQNILHICDQSVKIPMLGHISSLNVSVATAVLLYEVVRQRNQKQLL